jgi:FixJ family two-component response regulator
MSGKVVIVDDDPSVRRSLTRLVEAAGFPAQAYGSGEELLNDGLDDVACALLDVNLGGMSGIETGRRLSATHPRIPILFITAMDWSDMRKEAAELGCSDFLRKPVRGEVLIGSIRQAVAATGSGFLSSIRVPHVELHRLAPTPKLAALHRERAEP